MILCENLLNVPILASSKYECFLGERGILIEKINNHFCKGCVRNCCNKITEFFCTRFLVVINFIVGDD